MQNYQCYERLVLSRAEQGLRVRKRKCGVLKETICLYCLLNQLGIRPPAFLRPAFAHGTHRLQKC